MALPISRNRTFIPGVTNLPAGDMNDLQDFMIKLFTYRFSDGRHGILTFDGAATVLGLVPSAGVYTMNKDIHASSLNVTGASTRLKMNGFRIFCSGTLTTASGGKIIADGNNASGSTPGAAVADGTVGGSVAGGVPNATPTGDGAAVTGFGGTGGAGGGGLDGHGGVVTAPAATLGVLSVMNPLGLLAGGVAVLPARGGSGGGGAVPAGTAGAGGAGGGTVAIAARVLSLAAATDITAKGGNGGNSPVNPGSGGGGGGGGILILEYTSKGSSTFTAAANCTGGAFGTKQGTGTDGLAGGNGAVFEFNLGS